MHSGVCPIRTATWLLCGGLIKRGWVCLKKANWYRRALHMQMPHSSPPVCMPPWDECGGPSMSCDTMFSSSKRSPISTTLHFVFNSAHSKEKILNRHLLFSNKPTKMGLQDEQENSSALMFEFFCATYAHSKLFT